MMKCLIGGIGKMDKEKVKVFISQPMNGLSDIEILNRRENAIVNIVNFLNKVNYQGLKIHSTYIVKNTILEELYNNGYYSPLSYDDYMDSLIYILTHISKEVVIHRITGDPSKDELVEPKWMLHKKKVLNDIDKIMTSNSLYQGMYYLDKNK